MMTYDFPFAVYILAYREDRSKNS